MTSSPSRSEVEPPEGDPPEIGPYVQRSRADWAALAASTELNVDEAALETLRGLRDPTDLDDVAQVYLPLTALIARYVELTGALHRSTNDFLRLSVARTPFVIGVAGSVAVGKSTTARLLRYLLAAGPTRPSVELVTTDGFLLPNAELERRGILHRKGFPESYDRRALLRFVMDVKSGRDVVTAPVYSHLVYDIVPGELITVTRPDILVVEGLNVLQPARTRPDGTTGLAVSDFFDFSVYVDAHHNAIREWYIQRFMALRDTAFRDPRSFFTRFAALSEDDAREQARQIWDSINGPNLAMNIKPTRGRATAVLRKDPDHRVRWVRIRKV